MFFSNSLWPDALIDLVRMLPEVSVFVVRVSDMVSIEILRGLECSVVIIHPSVV
jgi:hypothetical protein